MNTSLPSASSEPSAVNFPAATDGYWQTQNFRPRANGIDLHSTARLVDNLPKRFEAQVLGIMGWLDTRVRKGISQEHLSLTIANVIGEANAAKIVRLYPGQKRKGTAGLLVIECRDSVTAFDLRRYLSALSAALKPAGITRITLR